MKEREVEAYLVARVEKAGGITRKLKWIGRVGAPDRLVILNGPHFVELKRPGGKPRPEQLREFERMGKAGAPVHVLDSKEKIDEFMAMVF